MHVHYCIIRLKCLVAIACILPSLMRIIVIGGAIDHKNEKVCQMPVNA